MEMLESSLVQILLWLVAAAATAWIFAPGLMYLLGKTRFWMDVSDDPAAAEPDARDGKLVEHFRQFVALGFRPAGKTMEHGRFMIPLQWKYTSRGAHFLASPDGKTFVALHRSAEGKLVTTAHSIFEQGGLIMTVSPGATATAEVGGNYKREAVGETRPDELLGMHARRLEEFARARSLNVKAATMREIAAEDEKHTRLLLPKLKLGQYSAILFLFIMPAGMMLVSAVRGRMGGMAPVLVCALAAFYALVRWSILPSRIPMMVRMAIMGAALFIPSTSVIRWMTPDRMVGRALDRMDAKVATVDPGQRTERSARMVSWIVQHGRHSCTALIERLESARRPETRAVAHDALVSLHGSDLGETRAAWEGWCAEVKGARPAAKP